MSTELDLPPIDCKTLQDAIAQLRAGGNEFELFACQQLDELENLREELEMREQELRAEQRILQEDQENLDLQQQRIEQLHASLEQSARELQQRARRLETAQAQFEEERQAFEAERTAWESQRGESEQLLFERINELEAERAVLTVNLEQARADLAREHLLAQQGSQHDAEYQQRIADLEHELATANETHADLERQLAASREQIAELGHRNGELSTQREELARSREQLQRQYQELLEQKQIEAQHSSSSESELVRTLAALEKEKQYLENDLEMVRNRVAELAEQNTREKHRWAEERAEWLSELKQLRKAIELQTRKLNDRSTFAVAPEPRATGSPADTSPAAVVAAVDPVLDSVMAQFESVKRDLSRRRSANPPPESGS